MKKEQLIRICLAMLLASATLMLSSCKKEPKDKAPEEALVGTRWQTSLDIPGILEILDEEDLRISSEISFDTRTEGFMKASVEGQKYAVGFTYSYDAPNKGYLIQFKLGREDYHLSAKVNWDTDILTLYEGDEVPNYQNPLIYFRRVK